MRSDKPPWTHAAIKRGSNTQKCTTGIGTVRAIGHAMALDLLALMERQRFRCRQLEPRQAT